MIKKLSRYSIRLIIFIVCSWLLSFSVALSPIVLSGGKYDACKEACNKAEDTHKKRGLESTDGKETRHDTILFEEECECTD